MGYYVLMQNFGRVVSSGQPCTKTLKISSEDVGHVRGTEISILEFFDVLGIDYMVCEIIEL